ncbi:DNA-binding domain-containing protein [Parabacteroides goldsteinii]|jgi:hypothetical protein
MAKKTILTADLYDNAVTEKKGDYTAKATITGTVRNEDLADRIVDKRTEYRKETIINILTLADEEKAIALSENKSVIDGVGQYWLNIIGAFDGENAPFDPSKHKLSVAYAMSKALRNRLSTVEVQTRPAKTGPFINLFTDSTSGEVNGPITSGSPAVIDGVNIKVAGDDPAVGVFFTKEGGSPVKCPLLIHNNPSQLTVMAPALEDGEYTLSITTQSGAGNKLVKESRTYTFPVLLYVGNKPGGGNNDRPEIE